MVLKLPKIVSSLQIFADVSKKSKAVIAIYGQVSGSSRFALLENGIGYYTMTKSILAFEVDDFLKNFCRVSTF